MAETKPTAGASVKATSVQAKKTSNAISWIAPIFCIVAGYCIWRFILGDPGGFDVKGEGWFWPNVTHCHPAFLGRFQLLRRALGHEAQIHIAGRFCLAPRV